MRLNPTKSDVYAWNFLPEAAHLFAKCLSKHGVVACQQLKSGIGRSFEAVATRGQLQLGPSPTVPKSLPVPDSEGAPAHESLASSCWMYEDGTGIAQRLEDASEIVTLRSEVSSLKELLANSRKKVESLERQLSHALATVSSHEASEFRSHLTLGQIAELVSELRRTDGDSY